MNRIGILAYGSLIEEPGIELEPLIIDKICDIETPFKIEFARTSHSRDGAPTVVPVENGGAYVKAVILLLKEHIGLDKAKDLVWRRETRNEKSNRHYTNPLHPSLNQVVVEQVSNLAGIKTVLYTNIGANIDSPTPEKLAKLAIKSAKCKSGENGKDGISYLISLKRQNIVTPLMPEYEKMILKLLKVDKIEDALKAARKNI